MQSQNSSEQWKALSNLFINIILPTLILNKLSNHLGEQGPFIALIVALLFPLTYGLYDYIHSKKSNIIAIFGLINILATGGLALLKLEGIWFAVKEASIPLLIGLFILYSAFTQKPLIQLLIYNDSLMNVDLIKSKLQEKGQETNFSRLIRHSTIYLALSFFLSAFLNFYLAKNIFTEMAQGLTEHQKSILINEQIAQMNWKSYVVIALPGLVITSGIIFYLFQGIKKLTGLEISGLLKTPQ